MSANSTTQSIVGQSGHAVLRAPILTGPTTREGYRRHQHPAQGALDRFDPSGIK